VLHLAAAGGWFSRRVSVFEHPDRERAERDALARAEAKRLIAADPGRAKELRIGRPDLGTTFDGGLVDVNHVPASVIATLPDMTGETARRLATIRDDLGGFSSLEDLDQVLDLPIGTVDRWRPVAVFLP
jgi:DNA uptake protein ComE-like DNA-binding protein